MGAVCGAVAGAVMAIGLKLGMGDTLDEGLRKLAVPQELRRRFEAEMGDIRCRELTGLDLSTKTGLNEVTYELRHTPQLVCFPAVGTAYRLVVELLDE